MYTFALGLTIAYRKCIQNFKCPSSLGCASHSDVLGFYNLCPRKEGRKEGRTHIALYIYRLRQPGLRDCFPVNHCLNSLLNDFKASGGICEGSLGDKFLYMYKRFSNN